MTFLTNTEENIESACLGKLFDLAAERFSATPAVVFGNEQLSYRELQRNANLLADYLVDRGIQSNTAVAVCLQRSIRVSWVVLGIIKAGAAYVPLDPQYPRERLRYMLEDSAAKILISDSSLLSGLPIEGIETLVLDQSEDQILKGDPVEKRPTTVPQDLAYIIYTSGSTGKPKGVAMPHQALANLALWQVRDPVLGKSAKTLQFTPLSFDVHFQEFFGTWLTGGTLVVVSDQLRLDTLQLLRFMRTEKIERLYLPFVALQSLAEVAVRSSDEGLIPSSLSDIITAGEQLQITRHIVRLFVQLPDCKLHNHYGPSETHVVTAYTLEGPPEEWPALPPIGKPVTNCTVHLLDEDLQPVIAGEEGEIFIGGRCVAQGYYGKADLTAERFFSDLFTEDNGWFYRTGDIGRQRPDGNFEYLGRIDEQVKIRGYRVEPGEIELAISSHPAVAQAAVCVLNAGEGSKSLVAYFTVEKKNAEVEANSPGVSALRHYLKEIIPDYMVPSFFIRLEEFPRTPSGKVDRRAFPKPETKRPDIEQQFVAPKGPTEELLAELWRELLQFEKVGALDNFFDLGGTSLLCIQMVALLEQEQKIDIPVAVIFQEPTIRALARNIEKPPASTTFQTRKRIDSISDRESEVAIIGMAGRFPGAKTIEQLWNNLRNGVESTSFFSDEELDVDVDPVLLQNPLYVKARGILEDAEMFDTEFFGISPLEAQVLDPQQRIFLEIANEAFERAGYNPKEYSGEIGVFAGSHNNSYFPSRVQRRPDLIERLGEFQTMVANEKDYISTRIAYKMNLKGPALSIHTACSTSLVAVVSAVESLLNHDCDMALAGGVALTVPQRTGYLYEEGAMLSKDGHCRPFDASATGTVFSDGAGVVLLKRLSDARRDGDVITAVIRGAAVNNDGADKMSFSAPSINGQAAVIAHAQAKAGVTADSISYVETHGTATPLGDPIEVSALTQVFRGDTDKKSFCAIGSVKSNFGHLTAAAGVAGLIKTALSLKHAEIPPTLHFHKANPQIDFDNSPFFVNTELRSWERGVTPRRAGISSFGVGGTNAHVILEEAPPQEADYFETVRPYELIPISSRNVNALDGMMREFQGYLTTFPSSSLADMGFTLRCGREHYKHRQYYVCRHPEELSELIASPNPANCARGKVPSGEQPLAFMFPGQGAQYVGMGRSIYELEPVFAQTIDLCADILQEYLGEDIRHALYPEDESTDEAAERLKQTRFTQPAIFMIDYALAKLWMHWGFTPQAMIGHSIGEFVCACLSGVFSLEDALKLVAVRADIMQKLPTGSMLSVQLPAADLKDRIDGSLSIACINEPSLCVLSGPSEAISDIQVKLENDEVACRLLKTSHAFHSSMMDPAAAIFLETAKGVSLSPPKIPFVSNVTGHWISEKEALEPDFWAYHLRKPVLFAHGIKTLCEEEPHLLLEVGPRATLTTLARRQLQKTDHTFVASLADKPGNDEWRVLLSALGKLWINGASPDWTAFSLGKKSRRIELPTYRFQRKRCWIDAVEVPLEITKVPELTQTEHATENLNFNNEEQNMVDKFNQRKARLIPEIQQVLEEVSGLDIASTEASLEFFNLGLDSLALTQAALVFKKRFSVEVSFRQLMEELTTCEMLAEYLDSKLPPELQPVPTTQSSNSAHQTTATYVAQKPAAAPVTFTASSSESSTIGPSGNILENVIAEQMKIMSQQLQMLSGNPHTAVTSLISTPVSTPVPTPEEQKAVAALSEDRDFSVAYGSTAPRRPFGAQARISTGDQYQLNDRQRVKFEEITKRYTEQTATSKKLTQKFRKYMADPRTVSGFSPLFKEVTYPIVVHRSAGSKLWDVDGNEYIDLISGFGSNLFGASAAVIADAIKQQIEDGYLIGPQHPYAGEVASLICELTGMERVTFCNSGSEAVLGATRAARTVTGKQGIVVFEGAYHGILDEVIVRGSKDFRALPAAAGVATSAVQNMHVVPYGRKESLDIIHGRADQLAAVLVESVQSRRPDFQPREFLHDLRRITEKTGVALIFDECITGFRLHPQGAQGMYGVKADLASYGKVIGGGLPFGIVAGQGRFMDVFDGGFWNYGDNSIPNVGVTYYAGTFTRHPLALAAAKSVLERLKEEGPALQEKLNATADAFAAELNNHFQSVGVPMHMANCGSMMNLTFTEEEPFGELLYVLMRSKGVHIWNARPSFINLAHTPGDLEFVIKAFKSAIADMQVANLLSCDKPLIAKELDSVRGREQETSASNIGQKPPVPDARLGRDPHGKPAWFVADPQNPGKFMKYEK